MNKGSICKNCGSRIAENFCPKCGQKKNVHRFTLKHIIHDFIHVFTHLERGLPFLIKELFIRPGDTVREYIEGKRNKYYNPFQYFVLSTAVVVFLTVKLDLGTLMIGNINMTGEGVDIFRRQFFPFFYQYFNIFQFVTLPLLSFFSYLFFRKSGYNYAENLVLNTFYSSQRHFLFIVFSPFMYFFKDSVPAINSFYLTVWTLYYCWGYVKFFRPKSSVWGVIKTLLITILFIISNGGLLLMIFYFFFFKR